MAIHDDEDILFKEWQEKYESRFGQEGRDRFCPDGLHYTGTPDKSSGAWVMMPDRQQDEQWGKSILKIAYLCKDHNDQKDGEGVDVRTETGLSNVTNRLYHSFYARYHIGLYGFLHIQPDGTYPNLEEAKTNSLVFFHQAPVVRINLKKFAGSEKCSNKTLRQFIEADRDLIERQLNLYGANVYVCCDKSENDNPIWDFLESMYDDIEPFGDGSFIYFSRRAKKVFIWQWHMSARVSYRQYYAVVHELALFMLAYPHFFE